MFLLNGTSSKFIVSILGVVSAGLATFYGTARWEPIVVMALSSIAVYLVPNSHASLPSPPPRG